jgi:hypothetical protein
MVRSVRASVIGLAVLSAALLPAQDTFGTAADLQQFASALNEARYSDLAEEVIKNAIESGVQDPNGLLAYALCEVSASAAFRTTDTTARFAKLKESVTSYENYLKQFPTGTKAAEARLKLSEVLRAGGENAANVLRKETDATKKEALKNEGLNFFTKAEVLSKTRIDEIGRIPRDQQTEELQDELVALKFTVARMPYSKALLHENRTGVEAQSLLNDAQTLLEEFDIDAPQGHPLLYEARRALALIAVERGDEKSMKSAEETLGATCDELAAAAKEQPALFQENEVVRELTARMFLEKAEFLVRTKKPADWKGALETTDTLYKIVPDVVRIKEGKQALVILAEAYSEEGKTKEARTIAQLVYDHDPSGDAGEKARGMLEKLVPGGGGDSASLLKGLQGAVERGDIPQAERLLARLLGSAEAKEKPDLQAEALLQIGGLYFNKGLYVYAGPVFAAIAETFASSPAAPQAKFNEAMSYARQSQLDGRAAQKYWRAKSDAAQTELITKFASSKEAADVSWFVAEKKRLDEKPEEALDLYLKVPPTSTKYAEAQHMGASLAFDLANAARNRNKPDEAVANFKKTETALKNAIGGFETAAKSAISASEVSRLKDSMFRARLLLAGLYIQKEMKKPDDALKLLEQVEADVKDDNARLGLVWSLRIKAMTAAGRGKEVVPILERQIDVATPETLIMVAAAVDKEARERMAAKADDAEIDELLRSAAKFYSKAVDRASGGIAQKLADEMESVGQRLLSIGARLSKLPDDLSLDGLEPNAPIAEKAIIEHAKRALEMSPPSTEIDIERARAIAFAAAATDKWIDAVTTLKEVADKLHLFNEKNQLNKEVAERYRRLPDVYQDLAVAYIRAAKGVEKAHYESAKEILIKLIRNSSQESKRYWQARYLHLVALKEAKEFAELDQTLDGLARTAPAADNDKYGIKTKIDAIRALRDKKIDK